MLKRSILFKKNNLPLRQIIKKRMTKSIFLFLLGILSLSAIAQPKLSEEARISLMTSAPYDEEVFTVYGHAALRIYDPKQNIDYIFNYGIFDFSKPNFIYRFAKGETDYKLGVADFQDYVIEYQMRGSDITEQVLNLTKKRKSIYGTPCLSITGRRTGYIVITSSSIIALPALPRSWKRRSTGASIISIPINPRPSGILLIIVPETIRGSHSDAT